MKKLSVIKILFVVLFISTLVIIDGCGYTQVQQLQSSNSDQSNYDSSNTDSNAYYQDNGNYDQTLNEYGNWIMISPYGNVWKPFVDATWQPYDYGHWVYSNYGWTWVSYEPFGWIVYHYGYWIDNQYYGWLWVPSDDPWSPARVDWYNYGNYICWAPLPPPGINYGNPWDYDKPVWRTVQYNNFTQTDLNNYYVDQSFLRNDMGGRASVSHKAPDINNIRTRASGNVPQVKIDRENVKRGSGQILRMKVPAEQQRIIRSHATQIQRIIQPRNPQNNTRRQKNSPQNERQQNKKSGEKKTREGNSRH